MASKEQVQAALDQLWEKYGNTLNMLSDSIDKIEALEKENLVLKADAEAEPEMDLNLSTPPAIEQLEQSVLNRYEAK
jgi:hypothetical protein